MRKYLIKLIVWLNAIGVDLIKGRIALTEIPETFKQYRYLKRQNSNHRDKWQIEFSVPCFDDRLAAGGVATGHYFHQDLLVARRIYVRNPEKHVDVGSSVQGFVSHVAAFRDIEIFDIRPIVNKTSGITFIQRDIMKRDELFTNYTDSLSCLHALEHFGLGRYGDDIDIDGYVKGFEVLKNMLKPNGILYLSVPIGKERIEFNGHRIFSLRRLYELFVNDFELVGFSYVNDSGDLILDVSNFETGLVDNFGLNYGCGIFELKKRISDQTTGI